jgi:hypothetical protein
MRPEIGEVYIIVVRHGDGPHRELRGAMYEGPVRLRGKGYYLFDTGSMLHLVRGPDVISIEKERKMWRL